MTIAEDHDDSGGHWFRAFGFNGAAIMTIAEVHGHGSRTHSGSHRFNGAAIMTIAQASFAAADA